MSTVELLGRRGDPEQVPSASPGGASPGGRGIVMSRDLMSTTASVAEARRFVADQARAWTTESQAVFDIELACSELATNAVEYGVGSTFTVGCVARGDRFVLQIVSGAAADTAVPTIGAAVPPAHSLTGRGLWIVQSVSDHTEVSLADGAMTVRCEFARPDAR